MVEQSGWNLTHQGSDSGNLVKEGVENVAAAQGYQLNRLSPGPGRLFLDETRSWVLLRGVLPMQI